MRYIMCELSTLTDTVRLKKISADLSGFFLNSNLKAFHLEKI